MFWRILTIGGLLVALGALVLMAIADPLETLGALAILAAIFVGVMAFDFHKEGRRKAAVTSTIALFCLLAGIAVFSPLAAISFLVVSPLIWVFHVRWGGPHDRARRAS